MPLALKAVLFDIDGTLFNSDGVHFEVFQKVLAEYSFNRGRAIDEAFFLQRISGRSNAAIVADLFPQFTAEQGAAFAEYKEACFRERAASLLPSLVTPGLHDLLSWIDAHGVAKAAVTNAPRKNAEQMLSCIDRLEWFDTVVIGDECAAAKPNPEPYLEAMRRLRVAAGECLAFEDSPSGAAAAVGAGVLTYGLLTSQSEGALLDAGCHAVIRDFEDAALWRELRSAVD
eukprot:CAMPEP_0119362646 /NCGR_PEP_ID=MMETSP1334-20130426/9651_1 /TAXON_ID=127549 /ORGANISM="Calcidiscus leptoporus, Strain RCC1130" /LENGTH=228 /DNA_ID=CAMNT_0007377881 /DNA_START=103 /DNA_END=789 /DNA_ORIENTATION=+